MFKCVSSVDPNTVIKSYLTKWIMFAQHQFISETVPLCVEEVACPCRAQHLHKDCPERGHKQ